MKKLILLFTAFCFVTNANAQKTVKLFVADQPVICPGNYNADCIQIKEKKKGEWSPLKGTIEGFTYEAGYDYTLKVKKNKTGAAYTLVKVSTKQKTEYNPTQRLDGKKWYLHSLHEDTTYMNLLDTTKVYVEINMAEKRISGKGICNRFSGGLTINGNDFSVGNLASTKMACEGNILEGIVTAMFEKMRHYTTVGNKLILSSDNKESMVFRWRKE